MKKINEHLPTIMLFLALGLVLFSFLAPWLFTFHGSSRFDFTETGQIGDTIGGLMNPFIALAGVIMTFVAFYIQKQANDQLAAKTDATENKQVEDKYSLIIADLEYMEADLKSRIAACENMTKKLESNPYQTLLLEHHSTIMYKRMSQENRDNMMKMLSSKGIEKPSEVLLGYYQIVDYVCQVVDEVYAKAEKNAKDIFDQRKIVEDSIIQIRELEAKCKWSQGAFSVKSFITYLELCRDFVMKGEIMPIILFLPKLNSDTQELMKEELHQGTINELAEVSRCCLKSIDASTHVDYYASTYKVLMEQTISGFTTNIENIHVLKRKIKPRKLLINN